MAGYFCSNCNLKYGDTQFKKCVKCGKRLIPLTENMPHCPTCGSMQVQKISGLNRAAHGATFGLLSKTARSQYHCQNCDYKW